MTRLHAVAICAATAVLAWPGQAGAASPRTITVGGTGMITSIPHDANFTFGVSAQARTATGALAADSAAMTKVIAALKAHGVAASDLQTAQISLSPVQNQTGTAVVGYTATNSVTARVRDLSRAGPVVDAAVGAGANQVGGPSLTPADQQSLYRRALAAAIADARARAQAIATAAGVRLGPVRAVSESSTTTPIPFAEGAAAKASTPVEPGTVQTEADVTVVFGIA